MSLSSSSEDEDDISVLQSVKKADVDALSFCLTRVTRKDQIMERGEEGETALHWAALLGRIDMIKLLLGRGAEVKCPVTGPVGTGQQPIHWAASKGHLHVVDFLLKNGASIEDVDEKGCTPFIMACQRDQVTLLLFLLSRGANILARDQEGDTGLHWAAFKGRQDVCAVLVSKGVDVNLLDNAGQNALHLACVEGKVGVVDMLLDLGIDKKVVDKNGNTPLQLAKKKKHEAIVEMLENKGVTFMGMLKYFTPSGFFFGAPGRYQQQLRMFLFEALCLGYPYYFLKVVPLTLNDSFTAHLLFWMMSVVMWYSFWKIRRIDPGFLPQNSDAYQRGLDELIRCNSFENAKLQTLGQGDQVLDMPDFCHACKLVAPPRSKHCKFCKRCVLIHDHHCPYLDRCIGNGNRVYFTFFVWSVNIIGYIAIYFLFKIWHLEAFSYFTLLLMANCFFLSLMVTMLVMGHFFMVTGNYTTYECATSNKTKAFRALNGRYMNPYNRGVWDNVLEYFHLKPPLKLATMQPVTSTQSV